MTLASVTDLFSTEDFPARWHCGHWSDLHGWTHIASDVAIFGAYAAIPISIGYFVKKRGDVEIPSLYWLFAAFIFACGFGHLIEATIFWHPWYRLSALSKVVTAVVSWATVVAVIRVLPVAITLPGTAKLNSLLKEEIEERKRTEAHLKESEATWRALAETVPNFIFSTDASGRCDYVNQQLCDYTGLKPEEAFGDGWTTFVHADDRARCLERWRKSCQNGTPFEVEYRLRKHDGTYGWFIGRSSPVRNEAGHIEKWIGCCTEITQLKEATEKLSASEERFRQVVEATPTAILMAGAEGTIELVNSQAVRLFGYEREELLGKPVETLIPEHARSVHQQHREGYFQLPVTKAMGQGRDLFGLRKDGSEVPIEIGLNPVMTRDGTHVLAAISDISERKRLQEERLNLERKIQETQKLESLGVLAGGIAHDFNNLLTGILGNAALAKLDTPADSPVQQNLKYVEEASLRAADLCKQMLAYAGKGRFTMQTLDPNSVVEEILFLLQTSISKNCVLRKELASGIPPFDVDPTQIRQVLMNLVINASEAIGEQNGQITLRTGAVAADQRYFEAMAIDAKLPAGTYVYLEVSDNGCGMDQATLARIFDPFYTTKFAGRGLGLAAVLGIVRGHGGTLKVYSERGRGTTFKVLLPAATSKSVAPVGAATSAPDKPPATGRILVVDDELTVRRTATSILKQAGFEVTEAVNGMEAVAMFLASPASFDVVLMDLTMPQMDGVATFKELKRIRSDVHIVLMSGFNEQDAINRFTGRGLASFIQKPFLPEQLVDIIVEVLGNGN